ncbi:hypothetical protein AGR1_15340 [Agrobacterium sp. B1(2019)]|nr:hypothetical protein [Agrobacterium sp. B1(2019)]TZG34095.1 hypothetical protein AGR1_15340 [Agrobacterium sp. B1(2019)]
MREEHLWREWYAWFPVKPVDEDGLFWLEPVWRRRNPQTGAWAYKSCRSEREKDEEASNRAI